MTATSDLIMERRQMRRRLAFWRILAIIAAVVVAIVLIPRPGGLGAPSGEQVGRVTIEGVIYDDPARDALLAKIAKNEDIRALVVRINSPGGTVAGSEALYLALRDVAASKPVVAVMGETAASGGYVTALAAEHIVARQTTVTGSIGVVAEAPNLAGLFEMIGVEFLSSKSAPLKAEPSLTREPAPGALAAQQALIDDMFDWFEELVRERRALEGEALASVTDGRAFTGRQALELGLIDALGGENDARAWLDSEHGIGTDIKIRDWSWKERDLPWPLGNSGDSFLPGGSLERMIAPGPRLYAVIQ